MSKQIKTFIVVIAILLFSSCKKTTITPAQPTKHTIMIVNWSWYDVELFNAIDPNLTMDLMGGDTVYINSNEFEYTVKRHPDFNPLFFSWYDVYLAVYDNGVLKQTYKGQTKEFYIRYKAN